MNISIITVFPELYTAFLKTSLLARAQQECGVSISVRSFASVCAPKERIDEPTCGPGVGMVIKPEVVERCIIEAEREFGRGYKVFFSPQGQKLTQPLLRQLAALLFAHEQPVLPFAETRMGEQCSVVESNSHIILVCPRYEGMDARVEAHYADLVLSVGDYVLMGGDLPAQILLESLLRLMPGVVGKWESVAQDSFSGPFLDYPAYGLPTVWHDLEVPTVVTSGNHAAIDEWRMAQAVKKTLCKRFDWFKSQELSAEDKKRAMVSVPEHYVVLMHSEVLVEQNKVGCTSVTSIDLHDIARSGATYGLKRFFAVTPLEDQQMIMHQFLSFWNSSEGEAYNPSRARSTRLIDPKKTLDEVVESIANAHGKPPILIATSAKKELIGESKRISYHDQGEVWQHERPVLFVLGTGKGLAPSVLERCEYLLLPVNGLSDYNHLSVRSAAAIIFDRWLGLSPELAPTLLENNVK